MCRDHFTYLIFGFLDMSVSNDLCPTMQDTHANTVVWTAIFVRTVLTITATSSLHLNPKLILTLNQVLTSKKSFKVVTISPNALPLAGEISLLVLTM